MPGKIVSNLIWWVSPRGLRHRIVVPVFVGSNPITHPIKKRVAFATLFFIWVLWVMGFEDQMQRGRALLATARRSEPFIFINDKNANESPLRCSGGGFIIL